MMNNEELMKLLDYLEEKYSQLVEFDKAIMNKDQEIKSLQPAHNYRRASFMSNFLPFLIVGGILGFFVFAYSTVEVIRLLELGMEDPLINSYMTYVVALAFMLAVWIPGFVVSNISMDRENRKIEEALDKKSGEVIRLMGEITELKDKREALNVELLKYNELIPVPIRSGDGIRYVKYLLKSGSAQTLEQAVSMTLQAMASQQGA